MPKIIPFGDKILVKRKKVGEKAGKEGLIHLPDSAKERDTDLATVVHVPDHSLGDKKLLEQAEEIVEGLAENAGQGDAESLVALLKFNTFLKIKSVKPGDDVMISKYVGTTFHDSQAGGELTLVNGEDVIGLVVK